MSINDRDRKLLWTPASFGELFGAFVEFADPVVLGGAAGQRWDPLARRWR